MKFLLLRIVGWPRFAMRDAWCWAAHSWSYWGFAENGLTEGSCGKCDRYWERRPWGFLP